MSTISGLSAAVNGLQTASAKFDTAASNIVRISAENAQSVAQVAQSVSSTKTTAAVAGRSSVQAQEAGGGNLGAEFVKMIQAENAYKTAVKVVNQAVETSKVVIDLTG